MPFTTMGTKPSIFNKTMEDKEEEFEYNGTTSPDFIYNSILWLMGNFMIIKREHLYLSEPAERERLSAEMPKKNEVLTSKSD
ncbi:hypothetical protein MA16_Dca019675 [Dendrobium catenatum]|uniref:Uncharacterized protein n=1 Tax=Dendrobium catenatum TaxID=906689 RepID=A0A2I0VI95_9ASPA|nr:hypothetical protein MA16_Dca019675 [Dendrobium catenatum]